MRRSTPVSSACVVVALGAVLAACSTTGAATRTPGTPSSTRPGSAAASVHRGDTGATTAAAPRGGSLYLRAHTRHGARLVWVAASDGRVLGTLPDGVLDGDRATLYAPRPEGDETVVEALHPGSGQTVRSIRLPGHYFLPTIGADAARVGLSTDGRTLVLAGDPAPDDVTERGKLRTRFAIVETEMRHAPKVIDLAGNFSYDALSPDGAVLYLVEHVPADDPVAYQVRAYDVAAERLRGEVIVDKRAGELLMEGRPLSQVVTSDGSWVYTLYRNTRHGAFVHALHASNGSALCLFLPHERMHDDDVAAAWTIALDPEDRKLYAVNPVLGVVSQADAREPKEFTTSRLQPAAASTVTTAKWLPGSSPRAASAVSPDGATLVVGHREEVAAIDTATLRVRYTPIATRGADALAFDGSGRLWVAGRGALAVVDVRTGALGGSFGVPQVRSVTSIAPAP